MTIEQLKQFCSTDKTRPGLNAPFSQGEWTLATNARVAVRVPRLPDVSENKEAPDVLKLFSECNFDDPGRVWVDPPEPVFTVTQCVWCDGKKYLDEKEAPRDPSDKGAQPCDGCDGKGENRSGHVDITGPLGTTTLASIYIELIRTLPNCKIGLFGDESTKDKKKGKSSHLLAVCLRFNGGDGLLMPMRIFNND